MASVISSRFCRVSFGKRTQEEDGEGKEDEGKEEDDEDKGSVAFASPLCVETKKCNRQTRKQSDKSPMIMLWGL